MDLPLREVFIEMLLLSTTLDDSLNYGVTWGQRFGGGNQAGAQAFISGATPIPGILDNTGVTELGGTRPNDITDVPFNNAIIPDPTNLARQQGFSLGIIGQNILHKGLGLQFNSIAALVTAVHDIGNTRIVLSPKIITEDNVPAEIFVGINTPFKTQSVSNDAGSIITNNFEFRDIGTKLTVTPHIGNSDVVLLDIIQEVSSVQGTVASTGNSNNVIGPTTQENTTKTSVHVPDGYFVILSGMIQEEYVDTRSQVPCLGGIPLAGAAFSDKRHEKRRRNLMIFIRPQIIDTDEEIQNLTRHQQDIWKFKSKSQKAWVTETEQALDFFNVKPTMNTDDENKLECHKFAH
jgi:type III secretion protein C